MDIVLEGSEAEEKEINRKTGKVLVGVSPGFFRNAEVGLLMGNPRKAAEHLGWRPRPLFNGLVRKMVEADLNWIDEKN